MMTADPTAPLNSVAASNGQVRSPAVAVPSGRRQIGSGKSALTKAVACLAILLLQWLSNPTDGAEPTDPTNLFETRIRPILIERCYSCHSPQAKKVKGGLLLDSRSTLLKGGDSGPAIVPGHPELSRLIEAIGYGNSDLQMPPKGRLDATQIADLTTWVRMGAPWTDQANAAATVTPKTAVFDLEKRRQTHWSWQPIARPPIPQVQQTTWPKTPPDRFLLAKLEANGLQPAPSAARTALLRRLNFDLVGLPPSPEAAEQFLKEPSDVAYAQRVDQLLSSPQFGERWARHWLDLVRYSETLGHEFDYANVNAWRYRDYVIRALNADIPYDQFVREHLAGDLIDPPRRHPTEQFNESIIGTAFYWLGQREHSPVDVRQHQAEVIDNQIDVLTKTFLGLTVACARCHDHKFDAISAKDYYGLYGILSSSRYGQRAIDPPEPLTRTMAELQTLKQQLRSTVARVWGNQAAQAASYLMAAEELRALGPTQSPELDDVAAAHNLDPVQLDRWRSALDDPSAAAPTHPLFARTQRNQRAEKSAPDSPQSAGPSIQANPGTVVFADFTQAHADSCGWFVEGESFGAQPSSAGDFMVGTAERPVAQILETGSYHSGILSLRLQGALRSPTFVLTNRYIHILCAGRNVRINLPVANFTMIRDPIYGGLKQVLNQDQFRWVTLDVGMWKGLSAYLEFSDIAAPDPADDGRRDGFGPSGYLAVQRVLFSDHVHQQLPEEMAESFVPNASTQEQWADRFGGAVIDAVRAWAGLPGASPLSPAQARLLSWLVSAQLLDAAVDDGAKTLTAAYAQVERTIPDPVRVPGMVEGTGVDEPVFIRGNHRLPGERAPRRFLEALAGSGQPPVASGSGRWELAQHVVDPANPFLARVMVNRVWLHLFGRGLVPTPDDFGVLGQAPVQAELLDWLADWFRTEGGWSVKKLIRLLVTSSAYQMSSNPANLQAETKDPENQLWHRMSLRRLEGEAIRDAMLALSGRLDLTMFGPPVPIHLTEFMDGRGRPATSGPLDGAGRRSVYVEVRRNFISPMMRTFDMPVPFTTVGRRTVSNVPAQSLILMNDPFVLGEARRWAQEVLAQPASLPEARVQRLFRSAFNRPANADEVAQALSFLTHQAELYGLPANSHLDRAEVWTDLCHVLFNTKEFVFLN